MLAMKKQRYTSDFQEQAVAKAFARRGDQGIADVAAGLSMKTATLKGWMKRASQAQRQSPRTGIRSAEFTLAERLLALQETHGMSAEALNAWCRERGVFARDLSQWRQSFCTGGSSERRLEEAAELRQLKQAHAQLQREMNRKDKALAEAAALLILQKKVRALWEAEDA
jgi:transposase-like protein